MVKYLFFFFACFGLLSEAFAQETAPASVPASTPAPTAEPLKIAFLTQADWNKLKEGQKLEFEVKASGGTGTRLKYAITHGKMEGMEFDSLGHFSWTPDFNLVDHKTNRRNFKLTIEAQNEKNEKAKQEIELRVEDVNRAPIVGDLKPFYVKNGQNVYTIDADAIKDEDNDPIKFIPVNDNLPEGARFTEKGEFTWKPSSSQFARLRNNPIVIQFYAEDQPEKARTKGQFKIEVTQQDSPPTMQIFPTPPKKMVFREDATINLKFQLTDENGDDDIVAFSFTSENSGVPQKALFKSVSNPTSQYEFLWKPGYDFVKDPLDSTSFSITFFVMDKSNKRDERILRFTIVNTVNEIEKDQKFYKEYRSSLVRAWDLIEQLKETEKDLKKRYNRARKGKKGRSLTNASLGATTGIAPVVITDPITSKKVTTIGGTTVMTIGTLEATEVIGRSTKDLIERFNYILEKRNELQTKGDTFARKYSLTSARRKPEFLKDVDDFVALMNLKGLVALELDAGWKNKEKPTDENIARTFKDFSGE